jgi:hypothetical protein
LAVRLALIAGSYWLVVDCRLLIRYYQFSDSWRLIDTWLVSHELVAG